MESDTREARRAQPGQGRSLNGERSPGGSVRRARERAIANLPPVEPPPPLNPRSHSNTPPRRSPPSRSSPHNQSPLQEPQRSAPQRPLRPYEGTVNFQDAPTRQQQPPNYWEEGQNTYSGYSSGSSRPSTVATGSSTASIPDFPQIPIIPNVPPTHQMPTPSYQSHQLPPRRNLGPPPSARRGVSSYYSQTSHVPPIPEEMSDAARSSYASSHIPTESWGEGPPHYYTGTGIEEEEEEEEEGRGQRSEDSSGRQSQASSFSESSNLVKGPPRSKPLQPFMEPIESGDESASQSSNGHHRGMRELDWQAKQDERFRSGFGGGPPGTDPIGRHNFKGRGNLYPYSGYESDATFLDSPRSTSPPPMPKPSLQQNTSQSYLGSPSPTGSPLDPRVGQILGHLEKGGALASSGTASPGSVHNSFNEKSVKRPPPLNLESPGRQPGRGSASSLPELIRRATRLASNLDRGKTASRVGMLDMLNKKDMERQANSEKASRDGSISDMLAAFPSPTPTSSTAPHKAAHLKSPSPHGKSNLSRTQTINYGSSRSRTPQIYRGRRCCGMPLWAFILVLIIILLLIAAAVVIPVTLIVVPRQNGASPTNDSCKSSHTCHNGGTSLVISKKCQCVCSDGFTGSTCDTAPEADCAGTTISGPDTSTSYHNATVGDSLPRLLSDAGTNYSIPLSGWKLAAQFSNNNLSCTSENALVTFNQQSEKQRRTLSDLLSPPSQPQSFPLLRRFLSIMHPSLSSVNENNEDSPTKTLTGRSSAQSSNGIVFAQGSSPGSSGGSTSSSSPQPSSTTTSSSSSSNTQTITAATLDFARTAVLFVFAETSDLGATTTAMTHLASILGTGKIGDKFDASQTSAGGNVTVDLEEFTVGFGNGTFYGGKAAH